MHKVVNSESNSKINSNVSLKCLNVCGKIIEVREAAITNIITRTTAYLNIEEEEEEEEEEEFIFYVITNNIQCNYYKLI